MDIQNKTQEKKQGEDITNLPLAMESAKSEADTKFFDNLKWLTSRETVEYLRLPSLGALRQLVFRRQIPYCKLGRSLRFNRTELDQLLESSSSKHRRYA
jgi:excisionase family DNA binding protein